MIEDTQTPQPEATDDATNNVSNPEIPLSDFANAARNFVDVDSSNSTDKTDNGEAGKAKRGTVAAVGGLVLAATTIIPLGINATQHQAEYNHDQNQKWSDESNQILQQQEFENGLENGKVTIETPTPAPTETAIPAPKQIDQQEFPPALPLDGDGTIPAPNTH